MTQPEGRRYGGRSEAERRADRRARLVAAGLDLFGTEGWHAVTIERLCARASVATRSFYEEFPNRESLIRAVYDDVVLSAGTAVLEALEGSGAAPAGRIAAGIGAYLRHLTDDPRRARVAYREVRAVGGLEQHRHETMVVFAALVEGGLPDPVLPATPPGAHPGAGRCGERGAGRLGGLCGAPSAARTDACRAEPAVRAGADATARSGLRPCSHRRVQGVRGRRRGVGVREHPPSC